TQAVTLGYWMGEPFAGNGYMTEAVAVAVRYAFDELRLHRVEAACIPDNTRSIRLLEKAGFEREGLMRSYLKIDGRWCDHFLYARFADDVKD
ncbi:GNAT family N-acetyltransferase, partial [Roseibium sp.]|uniref:GNAT family N-acetyltransferase n=1 Tax=Roseibium sp. TaxID=1936156 RepID=UPI003D140CE9